ncbi:MAG TPA: DEAD/DEAH box helicase [Kofleriaceae bacterium]|nr:DEAD/DEAH box helicase [Kofleriaceae bacterium]
MQFETLSLSEPILRAVRGAGYETTTPIQSQAIPPALEGRDVLGCAQTGTGKTAAFSLPILQRLAEPGTGRRPIRALVVTPTRELAAQVGDSMRTYGQHLPLRGTVIFGGVSQARQVEALRRGVDILVATPGRLLDLIDQGHVKLDKVEVLVLDEADRMLDMGFLPDVKRILARVPKQRQTLFFSATMPGEIRALANSMLVDPVQVSVAPPATTAERVSQRVYLVQRPDKQSLLVHLLDSHPEMDKVLVFTRTKHGADRVAKRLAKARISAQAIHGGKSQGQRVRALDQFKRGETRVLVASDIAARGLDIDEVTHVFNFDLPNEPETYVHRIGRTARAGASGIAVSFCADEEREFLRDIERLARIDIPVDGDHPWPAGFVKMPVGEARKAPQPPQPRRNPRGNHQRPRAAAGGARQAPARASGDSKPGDAAQRPGRRYRGRNRPS